jgi:hypothetical protein
MLRGMRQALRESRALRGLLAVMCALVLAIRLGAPAGFMPTATAQGVVVTLCSGGEPQSITVDLGTKAPAQKHQAADAPCAFAAAPAVALAGLDAPAPIGPASPRQAAPGRAIAHLTPHRLAAPPPPAQGPPAAA